MLFVVLVVSMTLFAVFMGVGMGCKTNKVRVIAAVSLILSGVVAFSTLSTMNHIYRNSYLHTVGDKLIRSSNEYDDETILRLLGEERLDKPVTSILEQMLSKL